MIRKFVRLQRAYLLAYEKGLDLVQSEQWIKKRESHRGYAENMDALLEQLYYPFGRDNTENNTVQATNESNRRTEVFIEEIIDEDEVWDQMLGAMFEAEEDETSFDFRSFQQVELEEDD